VVTTTDVRQIDLGNLILVTVIALTCPPLGRVTTNASGALAYIATKGMNGNREILDLVTVQVNGHSGTAL
jgi:hypothetical protein